MLSAPKRRRFQFELRTLLVVVALLSIACGYVGWQANIVRERKAVIAELQRIGGGITAPAPDPPQFGSWIRRILGDVPTNAHLQFPAGAPTTRERELGSRIDAAFPELPKFVPAQLPATKS